MITSRQPDPHEHQALLDQLGVLPIEGTAWPRATKIVIWLVMVLIAALLLQTAAQSAGAQVNSVATGSILLCFMGLVILAGYMTTSRTRVTTEGIEQSWITRRAVSWQEIQYAKFIPLIASKRLICFTGKGRPLVFQAGTRELQIAFAHISLTYRRRS